MAKWSKNVRTKWHPPKGFFQKSASEIAGGLLSSHGNAKSAMSSLLFFINRAGSNMSSSDRERMEAAKKALQRLAKFVNENTKYDASTAAVMESAARLYAFMASKTHS